MLLTVLLSTLVSFACFDICVGSVNETKTPLYIGGLIPLSKEIEWLRFFGLSALVGIQRATVDINNRDDVLPNYTLVLNVSDTEANLPTTMNRFYEMLYQPPVKIAIIGPMLSSLTEVLAEIIGRWSIVEISPGASTPILSNREKYPHTFRIITSAAGFSSAQLQLFREFGWKKIGTIHQAIEPYVGVVNELQRLVEASNYDIIGAESFYKDPYEALKRLRDKDVRIIVGNFNEKMVRKVFCSIFRLGMYGPNYVWMIPGYYSDGWWKEKEEGIKCSVEELKMASEGYITVAFSKYGMSTEPTVGGMTPEEYRLDIEEELGYNISVYNRGSGAVGYDCMWTLALALHNAERTLSRGLDTYRYGDEEYARAIGDSIYKLSFEGVSGPIAFAPGGYRIGDLLIEQNVGGQEIVVGVYDNIRDVINWRIPTKDLWKYSGGEPPFDSDITMTVELLQGTPVAIVVTVGVVAALGITLSVMFLFFNFWKRKNRQIKMSSPKVNNIIVVGIQLAYLSVVLLGVDRSLVDEPTLLSICRTRSWIIPFAFTLAFGGMFTKMWRVYSIVIANKTKRKVIKDYYLFGIIALLLFIDFCILIPWQIIDPINIEKNRVPIIQTEKDLANHQRREQVFVICTSKNDTIWTMAMIIYKAFVVVFGAFLAWSTRNIRVSGLNDSYYVGLSIYNTVICCVVAVPLSILNVSSAVVTSALVSGFLLLCITASLCMLFFPKVIAVYRKNEVGEETFTGIRVGTIMGKPHETGSCVASTSAHPDTNTGKTG